MMRRAKLCFVIALFALGGCSFDASGPEFQGTSGPSTDGPGSDLTRVDLGPRPDKGEPADGPFRIDQTPPDLVLPSDLGPPCGGKQYNCKGDNSQICKGRTYVPLETCAMGCDKPSGRCNKFKTLNGASSYLDKNTGKWTVTGTVKLDTSTGTFTPTQPTSAVGVHLGTNLRILSVGSMEIAAKGVLKVTGNLPLLIVARDSIIINGDLDASADRSVPGPGGAAGGGGGKDGSGCGGGGHGVNNLPPSLGGAGGSHGGLGGMGGTEKPKAACGQTCASPLAGGSGGGDGDGHEGNGGAGGGGLQLTAGRAISVAGFINAGGGGGSRGKKPDILIDITTGSGGGGGSGGAIILEAPEIKVNGVVGANGGGGGGGASVSTNGGHGADGAASNKRAKGGAEGVMLLAGAGGNGSDEANLDGTGSVTGVFSSGGGGGGAGRVCVRSKSAFYSGTGKISPSPGSSAGALKKLVVVAP